MNKSPDRKYKCCEECGLDIRCGDVDRHKAGFHHKNRLESIRQTERRKALRGGR